MRWERWLATAIGFVLGSLELYRTLHDNPDFAVLPQEIINDPAMIKHNPAMASVNSALLLQFEGERIIHARFAAGGVAPMPLRLPAVEQALQGTQLTPAKAVQVAELAAAQVTPISDIRGSARYKRLLLRQQLLAALLALQPKLNPNAVMELL